MISAGATWFIILCLSSAIALLCSLLFAGAAVVFNIFHGMWKTWKQR
jgi:hypothetical protein